MSDKLKLHEPFKQNPPKQKLPGWIRWPLRILAYPPMIIDVYAQKIVFLFFKSRYKIVGGCKKRGNCCRFIHMGWPDEKKKLTLFTKIYVFWQTEVLGFYFRDFSFMEDNQLTKVMSCRYLSEKGVCKHYRLRPGICRNWPKKHLIHKPHLLKGCGFQVKLRYPEKI